MITLGYAANITKMRHDRHSFLAKNLIACRVQENRFFNIIWDHICYNIKGMGSLSYYQLCIT